MILTDVYQNAIQQCNKSIQLVQHTNEFFNSTVSIAIQANNAQI